MLGVELEPRGISKFGALLRVGGWGRSSGTPKDIISTILDTSFAMRSGSVCGRSFPTSLKLQRYIARANSGKSNCPDLVVSDSTLVGSVKAARLIQQAYHIFIRSLPGSLDRISKSFTLPPIRVQPCYIKMHLEQIPSSDCPSPTADLKSCSNLA